MKIGVCIPCYYNHVKYIKRVLTSISEQTRLPDIVAVSISGYPADLDRITYNGNFTVRFIHTSDNKGASENRNIAANAIVNEVDILSFFDADDYMHPQRLEIIEKVFSDKITQVFLHNYLIVSRDLAIISGFREICKQVVVISNTILDDAVEDNRAPGAHFGCVTARRADGTTIALHNGHTSCTSDAFRLQQFPEEKEFIGYEDSHYTYLLYKMGLPMKCSPDMLSLYGV